jgi:carbamoyltransferase
MRILGITDGHDAGACLLENGRIVAAVSEERLSGVKRQPGFPARSIAFCLRASGLTPLKINRIAAAGKYGRAIHRILDGPYSKTNPNLPMSRPGNRLSSRWQNLFSGGYASGLDERVSKKALEVRFRSLGFDARVTLIDHHLAHALTAARGSGFADALVVTIDAFGDAVSASVYDFREGALSPVARIPYPFSPALLYGQVTSLLGFSEGDEGKVSGMAATGDPDKTIDRFKALYAFNGKYGIGRAPKLRALERAFAGSTAEDIAAGLQRWIETGVSDFIVEYARRHSPKRLCLAGGLFANVKLNQAVAESIGAEDLYVFPHMGDGGLCVGAAFALTDTVAPHLFNPLMGPIPGEVPQELLSDSRIETGEFNPDAVAKDLLSGKAVGLVHGPLEFGPRALGGRSLLFSPRFPELAEQIGNALDRPEVMPFAPVIRAEDFSKFSDTTQWSAFRHMTVTAIAKPGIADTYPVAVHVDGTMRVQTVDRDQAPLLYAILSAMAAHSDPPMLINTSLNRHGEPIVAGAERAVELFLETLLSGLILGDHYLTKIEGS